MGRKFISLIVEGGVDRSEEFVRERVRERGEVWVGDWGGGVVSFSITVGVVVGDGDGSIIVGVELLMQLLMPRLEKRRKMKEGKY